MSSDAWVLPCQLLAGLSLLLLTSVLLADEVIRFGARPDTCVALHKGQICYRRIRLDWSTLDADARYCLLRDGSDTPLTCWRGNTRHGYTHDYASASEERYLLVRGDDRQRIADVTVHTAWVYRTNRRNASGWRLF